MRFERIRKSLAWLEQTPFHPQWPVFRSEKQTLAEIANTISGRVLDVGCGERRIEKHLASGVEYVGLDYYTTATQWYGTRPDVYGDAARLPIATGSIDTVLILDVLEHIPEPAACIAELARVLRPGGKMVIQVPFLYPVHDAPLDFSRWTLYGLRRLAHGHKLRILREQAIGSPVETAALLANLALGKMVLESFRRRHPLVLLGLVLPFLVLLLNIASWILSTLGPRDEFMPHGYRLILERTAFLSAGIPNANPAH